MPAGNTKAAKSANSTPIKKSFGERFNQFKATASPNNKETKANICQVFDEDSNMIGFSVNGLYCARDYFLHNMNCANILLYGDRLNGHVAAGRIASIKDIKYAFTDITTPTVLVSAYPPVENENLKEDMTATYEAFISYFTENGDTANNCKVKFNHLGNFTVTTEEEINGFFFLATLIRLPDRLKALPTNDMH